jgi:hypothetical protein
MIERSAVRQRARVAGPHCQLCGERATETVEGALYCWPCSQAEALRRLKMRPRRHALTFRGEDPALPADTARCRLCGWTGVIEQWERSECPKATEAR